MRVMNLPAVLDLIYYTLPCPICFTLTNGMCTCSSSIGAENVTCDIDTLQITHAVFLRIGPHNMSIRI